MVRTLPSAVSFRPDASRILAISFAMAVHALALLVLLLPLAQSPLPETRQAPETPRWTVPRVLPPPPLPPQPVAQPRTPAPRPAIAPVQPQAPAPAPAVVDQGTLPALPVEAAPATPAPGFDAGPMEAAQLRYAVAPPPPYPRDALRAGIQGTVLLRVLVDVDGRPLQVAVERSSGHRSLDREAMRQVQQRWRFEPALRDGRPVQAWGLVPIGFSLQ